MRLLIGLILMLLGGAVALYGIGNALIELVGLYETALDAPLDAPEGQESQVSRAMIRNAIIGVAGIPPLLVGSVLFYVSLRKRRRARRRHARSAPGAGGW